MAVSGINNYRNTLYQWQSQQLKTNGSSSGSSSSSSAVTSLFGNTSMVDQISSMVELTRYAMDSMGVSADSRVTFSQITKYQQQLQNEFNQSVKNGLASIGIQNMAGMSFSLDKNGSISAISANADDRKAAQAWLDANPSFGNDLRSKLDSAHITDEISFTISATGRIIVADKVQNSLQTSLDADESITKTLREAVEEHGLTPPLDFFYNGSGFLQVKGEDTVMLNEWLRDNQEASDSIKKCLEKNNVDLASTTFRLDESGILQATVPNQGNNDIQTVLDEMDDPGKKIYSALNSLGVDKNISFNIQVNPDGSVTIVSDHPDRDKVQKFFDDNPELIKKFRQIETLAGIDDARKAMQLSPSEMRKRVQIESMVSWWAGSNTAASYFGNYNSGSLSLLSGLNLTV